MMGLKELSTNEPPCSKLQGIKADLILSPHPTPLPRERERKDSPPQADGVNDNLI